MPPGHSTLRYPVRSKHPARHLIYHSGQLVRLTCSQSKSAQAAPPQGQPPALKQIALTDKQVEGVVSKAKPRRWLRGFLVVVLVCASQVRAIEFETSVTNTVVDRSTK